MAPPSRILASPNPPSASPGTVLLQTQRLILRRYLPSDAEAVSTAANHPQIAASMTDRFPSPYTIQDAEDFIANGGKGAADPCYPTHAAILLRPGTDENRSSSEPTIIGGIGFRFLDDVRYRTWVLGYFITPSAWGKGYATEAVAAAVRWTFETWPGLCRVEAEAYASNLASVRVLEKSGFRREGVRRRAVEKNGVVMDEIALAAVRADLGMEK
ncbi:hypothetical protein QQS21_003440 [Conoideocrella luteorostrata]|uniref:N-acetyltransferase domain-containing protein n=1 Tax=Conoideocrella luteorostrata TaxID=1105319 RepID=A0AAJ0CTA2_9HYPO|nr:hypothetical protein QQS21_003440 [Conoideocrella luteorostrata]